MSECELPRFYDWSEPIAGKKYVCCECSAPILKGEKHFRGSGKWDWRVDTFRQHLTCMEACMLIRDSFNGGECIGFGELKDSWWEMKREIDRDHKDMVKLRHLMAVILVRERKAKIS